jgi:hypothetical protein
VRESRCAVSQGRPGDHPHILPSRLPRNSTLDTQKNAAARLPAERRSHFYIEAARAHSRAAHPDQATAALWQARRAAPQHTRCNPAVSETVQALTHRTRRPPEPLLQLAAWLGLT